MSNEKNMESPEFRDNKALYDVAEKIQETIKTKENTNPTIPADKKSNREATEKGNNEDKIPAYLRPYAKAYPGEKAFHVTSDHQVFLEKNKNLAVLHQKSINSNEKVQTIKVK